MIKRDLRIFKSVGSVSFASKLNVTLIALYPNQMGLPGRSARSNASIVEPASPSATKFDDRERLTGQIYCSERRRPFGDIRMPICRNRNGLNVTGLSLKNFGKEFRVNQNAEEICQVLNV